MTTLRDHLVQYVAARRALGASFYEPARSLDHFLDFLAGERGQRLKASTARAMFVRMSRAIGLRPVWPDGRNGRGPRLQDFRHTFATDRMVQWYREGRNVAHELPKLATYLGHVDVGLTYWYIQAVPELLGVAATYLGKHTAPGARL